MKQLWNVQENQPGLLFFFEKKNMVGVVCAKIWIIFAIWSFHSKIKQILLTHGPCITDSKCHRNAALWQPRVTQAYGFLPRNYGEFIWRSYPRAKTNGWTLTSTSKMKRNINFQTSIFRFHVSFWKYKSLHDKYSYRSCFTKAFNSEVNSKDRWQLICSTFTNNHRTHRKVWRSLSFTSLTIWNDHPSDHLGWTSNGNICFRNAAVTEQFELVTSVDQVAQTKAAEYPSNALVLLDLENRMVHQIFECKDYAPTASKKSQNKQIMDVSGVKSQNSQFSHKHFSMPKSKLAFSSLAS